MQQILIRVNSPLTRIKFEMHCAAMSATAIGQGVVVWSAPKIGAKLAVLMAQSYYPLDDAKVGEPIRTSVSLTPEQHQDVELIAKLWNDLDKELSRRRPRKWKAASVMQRLIAVGIDGFWAQIGGRPVTKDAREEAISKVVSLARERTKK
ncbi:hypothetical protein [Hyalangium sp.]|uniref:hypothetical protein n=1 Tax=Hyalangium sp. TaxID=2028555 RepID=UPI002D53FEF6|nr:hypothetical protein [Hyalangium sp.]HYH96905.1 hypothetical protein [Hyalangium sp.]